MKTMNLATVIRGIAAPAQGEHDRAVGEQLRKLRKRKQISLQTLSAATGLSIGYLSQIERGLSSASVRALALIADGLGVGLDAIFLSDPGTEASSEKFVFRMSERKMLGFWRDGIEKELLTPGEGFALNIFLVHIAPGGISGESAYTHSGEEAGFVLDGEFELTVEGSSQTLVAGDCFRFKSGRPHRFRNASRSHCRVLWILVPGA